MTLIGGLSFAIFVTPWIAHGLLGIKEGDTRSLAALMYVFGLGEQYPASGHYQDGEATPWHGR